MRSALAWLMVLAALSGGARAQERALSYTREQSEAGRVAYVANCATCHGPHLSDGPLGKPLKGPVFMQKYGGRSVRNLYDITRTTMPTTKPGSLDTATYAALVAYVLQENAIVAGAAPLPTNPEEMAGMMVPGGGFSIMAYSPYTALKPVVLPNPLDHFTPVTPGGSDQSPGAGLAHVATRLGRAWLSPLRQIDRSNAANLRLVWSWTLPEGSTESVPLVRDGTMFVLGYGDVVQAIDARTGDLLWQYNHALESGATPFVKRGIAVAGDLIYLGTSDVHVVALNARTGAVVWNTKIGDFKRHEGLSGGPLVAEGKVMTGTTGTGVNAKFGGPQLVALDALTGKELWRLGTIAKPGEPGGNSWNGIPFDERNGASMWTPGSFDPDTGLAYFGTGNTYDTGPLLAPQQPGMSKAALYTNSTLAVDPNTGKLVWYFQHFPDDQWDLDWAFERQLVTLTINGAPRRALITSGKIGIYDALDARTGQFLFSIDLGLNNIVSSIDPVTGEKARQHRAVSERRQDQDGVPARRGREELPAGLLEPAVGHSGHAVERGLHGSVPGAGWRQRQRAVIGRELGHPAAARQRRQVRSSRSAGSGDSQAGVDRAPARADLLRGSDHRGRPRARRHLRSRLPCLRQRQRPGVVADPSQRCLQFQSDFVCGGWQAIPRAGGG